VFGDIEPDGISLDPRNKRIWEIAAPKVASGALRAIFIECSFNDTVDDNSLYGHLCPRHLIAELKFLAAKVVDAQEPRSRGRSAKRKRNGSDSAEDGREQVSPRSTRPLPYVPPNSCIGDDQVSHASTPAQSGTRPRSNLDDINMRDPSELINGEDASCAAEPADVVGEDNGLRGKEPNDNSNMDIRWKDAKTPPLEGLSVYIIHIKDTLTDGPHPGEQILQELRTQSDEAGLGCKFFVPKRGEGIWI
jgi:hypothetical protein